MQQRTGTMLCVASGAAFGAMAIFGKLAYDGGANVATVLSSRFILAALLFWALVAVTGGVRVEARAVARRDWLVALGLGAFGYAVQAGCYFAALERIDASLLSLLLYTFPAMVAVTAVLLGRDRLDLRRVTALLLASGGLVLVLSGAGPGAVDGIGVGLALAAAVVYSAYILTSQGVASRMRPELLSAIVCTGAAVPLTLGAAVAGELRPGDVSLAGWGWMLCLVAISTVAAINFFFAGLRRVGPTSASILATVEPVVTVLLAYAVFGEVLGAGQVAGAALVLAAVPVLHARLPAVIARTRSRWLAERASPASQA